MTDVTLESKSPEEQARELVDMIAEPAHKLGMRHGMLDALFAIRTLIERGVEITESVINFAESDLHKCWFKEDYPTYQDYLSSSQWKEKSEKAKERAGWCCQLCNKPIGESVLHTHHRTYERIGFEDDSDLIVLCADCHAKFHNKETRE